MQKTDNSKKDYKNELSDDVFKVFSKLREIRRQIANEDAVPAYAVCTDQELSEMASLPEISDKTLKSIKGFGDKKFEKYGLKFLDGLQSQAYEKGRTAI